MAFSAAEFLINRVDTLTGELNGTIAKGDGAAFALALSMIFQAQQLSRERGGEEIASTQEAADRGGLYTPALVERMGQALHAGERGELALLLSWLDTAPVPGRREAGGLVGSEQAVPLAQAAVLAKSYNLLDEIKVSQVRVAA